MTTAPPKIVVERDLVYAQDGRPLLWDIYSPDGGSADRPVVLLLHGGGLRGGHRTSMAAAATAMAERGFVAIAPEYRLLGEASWPQSLNDVRCATRAVRAQAADLGADPDLLFAIGFSAGGFLALMAAGAPAAFPPRSSRPHSEMSEALAGVAAFFPVVKPRPAFAESLGVSAEEIGFISPMTYAAKLPPTLILSGDADPVTPVAGAVELYQAITSAGGVADLRLYAKLIHEFGSLPGMMTTTMEDTAAFFRRTVIDKTNFDRALEDQTKWWADILAKTAR